MEGDGINMGWFSCPWLLCTGLFPCSTTRPLALSATGRERGGREGGRRSRYLGQLQPVVIYLNREASV